ncbi:MULTISPECIES: SDR family NAD(P)-dependent oxidoreductase [unclassified Sphingobium]|uniref:SDR family NAD(P)-dependent oxidoreductase n=1 Tax=unclassified Sphingobium TaxID=2611147 RepID=UPI000D164D65|nr:MULTISPECIES: SDR family oxidoreductase [unclassified Sphingobium]MBG6119932.1 NAD(P)-dependent dehydrogenase (short-subunit alcohol dehydrogenase family) [Sphingobium sp. JAI105]PSO11901.1 NAD(P)-dependent oxidoreductase [Sphingobium sp. AEW4]TWC96525.1 3-oxoacyl-[acyl-carrier protein] reductase [Sphingobium sp. AEW010]TWD16406.1 3-oxoacyl-[acyl-carrier protein] reductase [Sphingobium sp. AEW013]TWD19281.1 3-oxoacyl-[acyl-carrier protein] reductase [Sphingobium sp. AEW001]
MAEAKRPAGLEGMFGLAGKSALVVDNGGNAGIDVAVALAEAGATVTFVDRDQGLIDAVVAAAKDRGGRVSGLRADVEQEQDVVDLFATLDKGGTAIDIFVSCCGLTTNAPLETMTAEFWDEAQSTNLRCVFLCAREVVKRMAAAGNGGRIVIISTVGALHPVLHGNVAYGAARSGALSMAKTIAYDYAKDGIRANCLLPGAFVGKVRNHPLTMERFHAGVWPDGAGKTRQPLGFGAPEGIGAAVVFLAGPSGGFISGQALALDGGFAVH